MPNSKLITFLRSMLLVQFFGVASVALTFWVLQNQTLQQTTHQALIEDQSNSINRRIQLIENSMRAVRALFAASREVDSDEFKRFLVSSDFRVLDYQNSSRFLKSWFWISANSNAEEPTFYLDRMTESVLTPDKDDIRKTIDGMYQGQGTELFAVSIEDLGFKSASGHKLVGIVQPVLTTPNKLDPVQKLRGYVIGLADINAVLGLHSGTYSSSILLSAEFDSPFVTLASKRYAASAQQAHDAPSPKALVNRTPLTMANGQFFLNWKEAHSRASLALTPIRVLMFAGLCFFTVLGWRVTARIELLHRSLQEESERSDAANREKARFLANMSHEIRTPLNAIVGMGDLIGKGTLSPKQTEYLKELNWSVDGLTKLIDNVLDFSKLEAGQVAVDATNNSIPTFFTHVSNSVSALVKTREIDYYFNLDSALPAQAVFDSHLLRQVCLNLLTNAIKFTHSGFVAFIVRPVHDTTDADQLWIEIIVKDSGIGIPDSAKDRLFQRFSQVDNSTTRQFGGSGLGLSIVKQLVTLLGGTIDLHSKLGEGSRFSVRVPMARFTPIDIDGDTSTDIRGHNASPARLADKINSMRPLKVLIAEDDRVNRLYIGELMRSIGHTCEFAEDGYSAYQNAISQRFDIIFMDCQMPVWDGYTTTEYIRKASHVPAAQLPIIALTAHALPGEREKCLAAGMSDFMTKPVRETALLAMIKKWSPATKAAARRNEQPVELEDALSRDVALVADAVERDVGHALESAREPIAEGHEQVACDTTEQFINRITLEQLRRAMGDSYSNLIQCFVEDLSKYEKSMRLSHADGAYADVARIAHTLKSSSMLVGAHGVNRQARDFEQLLLSPDLSEQTAAINEALTELIDTMRRLSVDLQTESLDDAA